MSSSPSLLKRSIFSLLSRIPEENVFRPGYNFPGALTTILNERFDSLGASGVKKLPEYDERVLRSMEEGLKDITSDRWKKKYPMSPTILLPASSPIQYYRLLDAENIVGTTGKAKPFWRTFFELEAEGFESRVNSGSLDEKMGLPKRESGMTTEKFREELLPRKGKQGGRKY